MFDQRFRSLIGNARTLGLITFLVSIPIGVPTALSATRDPFASTREALTWLAIGAVAQVALGVTLWCGQLVLRRCDYADSGTRVATVAVAAAAGMMRGVVLAVLPGIWGLTTYAPIAVRILSSTIIFGLWLVAIGAAVSANERHRSELASLVDELALHELQLRIVDDRENSTHRNRAAARVSDAAAPIATALSRANVTRDYARTAQLVQDAIEERIRPLSHEFWFDRAPVIAAPRSQPLTFLGRVVRTPIPWQRAVPVMCLVLAWNGTVFLGSLLGLLAGLVAGMIVASIVFLCTTLGRAHRLPANIVMYLLLMIIPGTVELAIVESVSGERLPTTVHILLAVGIPLGFLLSAIASTVIDDRAAVLRALRLRIADDEWDEHLGELHRHRVEAEVGSFLHNTVQSRLMAASLQLQNAAARDDRHGAERALLQAREALDMAEALASEVAEVPPRQRMEYLVVAWEGLADVSITLPDRLEPEGAWLMVAQAVDECVVNSIRHGHATRVEVRVQQWGDAIHVTVDDDGEGVSGAGGSGLGNGWLDRTTAGQWSLTPLNAGHGSRAVLTIPTL